MAEEHSQNEITDYLTLYLRGTIDSALLFLRSLIVLNSGALALVLLSITKPNNDAISSVLINVSSYFGYGLTFAIVGAILYSPYMNETKELHEITKKNRVAVAVSTISLIISVVVFLWGVWDAIGMLKDTKLP